ncbi:MAG: hypothetical protein AB7M93_09075 [Candidatus Obscuribacterales bacterium]
MDVKELNHFIRKDMATSHIYQSVILWCLLEGDGRCSIQSVAQRCSEHGADTAKVFEKRLKRYPKQILQKRKILKESSDDMDYFELNVGEISEAERKELLGLLASRVPSLRRAE